MKTAILNTKCFSGSTLVAPVRLRRSAGRVHTPLRRPAELLTGSAPELSYTEAPAAQFAQQQALRSPTHPRVLHVDADAAAAAGLARLLSPEADVVHAATLAEARRLLGTNVFSLLVIDPALPDGDPRSLLAMLAMLASTPVLVYAAHQPEWRGVQVEFIGKPWATPRQLWVCIGAMLGISNGLCAGA